MRNRSRAGLSARPASSAASRSARTSRSLTDTKTPSAYSTSSSGAGRTDSSTARCATSLSRGSALSAATSAGSSPLDDDPVEHLGDGALLDRLLTEGGQDVRNVVHEGRIGPDDEHAAELLAVREEEPRRAVEPDRGLARARAALDDKRAIGLRGDEPVLVGLDGGDDVAHPAFAATVELLEQEVAHGRALDGGSVERLVGDVDEPAAFRAEAAALSHPLRLTRRRGVERARSRRLPVHDERLVRVVVHPAAADVERAQCRVQRQPAEAQAALGVLERRVTALEPRLHRDGGELGRHPVLRTGECLAHLLELRVRVVDVGLFRCELGMRHTVQATAVDYFPTWESGGADGRAGNPRVLMAAPQAAPQ